MGRPIKKGSTSQSTRIRIIDSTDGTPETGVTFNTAGIDLWYQRLGANKVSITEATLADAAAAYSSGGVVHIGDGYYRVDVPDAAFATGANSVMVGGTVTGMIVNGNEHTLVDYDPYDAVHLGLSALPNAAADAAGGLPISAAGGLDLDTKLADGDLNGYFGAIWFKGTGGVAGSTFRLHGKHNTPTTLESSAVTLLAASKFSQINLIKGATTFTLPAAMGAVGFQGEGSTVDMNGKDLSGTSFTNVVATGVGIGTNPSFSGGALDAITLPAGTRATDAVLASTITIGADGSYDFDGLTTETGADAVIDGNGKVAAVGLRRLSGDLTINGLASGSVVTVAGSGTLTLGTGQSGVTINVLSPMTITNNGSASVVDLSNSAAAVWGAQIADYSGIGGSMAEQLAAAGAAGDPWATALPGLYGSGTAGDLIGTFLDRAISDTLAAADYTAPMNTEILAAIAGLRIKKNTAVAAFPFLMVDTSGNPATGLTVTATRSLDGAAFGACANAVSEIANGWYAIDLAAGDLNGDTVALKFTATGAKARNITIVTQP